MTRLSFNVNAQALGDEGYFLETLRALRPTTLVVMDGLGLAERAYNAIGGNPIVAHRVFGESNIHLDRTPRQAVEQWKREGAFHIYRYGPNEPTPNKQLLDWEIECADRCRDTGIHRVLGNIGPATWEKTHIGLGQYDEYLYCLNRHEGWHVAGWHEYSSVIFPLGAAGRDMHALFDRDACQSDKWPSWEEIDAAPDNWHIFRTQLFTRRERILGLKPHQKILTECFWDDMPDIDPLLRALERERNSGRKTSGVRSLRDLWRWYFPQWTFEQAAMAQLAWADDTYPSEYLGFDLFAWNYNPRWVDYNYAEERGLVESMIQYAVNTRLENPPVQPYPPPNPIGPSTEYELVTTNVINLRSTPDTSSPANVLYLVPNGARVHVYIASAAKFGNYIWYTVKHGAFLGWMALVGNRTFQAQFREVALPSPPVTSYNITIKMEGLDEAQINGARVGLLTFLKMIQDATHVSIE